MLNLPRKSCLFCDSLYRFLFLFGESSEVHFAKLVASSAELCRYLLTALALGKHLGEHCGAVYDVGLFTLSVIGNGDVTTGEEAVRRLEESGCDFIMIGRGALGYPWIFRDAAALWRGEEKPAAPTCEQRIDMLLHHFDDLVAFKGEYAAVREMRKQIGWYLKGMHGSAEVRRRVNNIEDAETMKAILFEYISYINGGTTKND